MYWMHRIVMSIALAGIAAVGPPAQADTNNRSFGPLVMDPPPKRTTRSNHYVISNEDQHQYFRDAIKNLGGVMMGVGADQLYIMAGWVRPKILVPMDFDQYVVDLHSIYGLIFLEAKTPDIFRTYFDVNRRADVEKLIRSKITNTALADRYVRVFKFARKTIAWRMKRVHLHYKRNKVPMFLTDQATYDFIVSLHREGRVHPLRGDLTKDKAVASISRAARNANLPVRVLYLSNAEQYFSFRAQYRKNIIGLPFDEKSVVLRTYPQTKTTYKYYIQPGQKFQAWMKSSAVSKVRYMLHYKTRIPKTRGRAFLLNKTPTPSK